MAFVNLRIDKYLEGDSIAKGAIVDVRRIDERGQSHRVARTTIPIGRTGKSERLSLEPGSYEFAALLPSGDVLTQAATLEAESQEVSVEFDMGHSGHEWMSWQHALGNIAGADELEETKAGLAAVNPQLLDMQAVLHSSPFVPGAIDSLSRELTWVLGVGQDVPLPLSWTRASFDLGRVSDGPFTIFRIAGDGPPHTTYAGDQFPRTYAIVRDGERRQACCALPLPWRDSRSQLSAIELLVAPDSALAEERTKTSERRPWSVSTVVRDPDVAPMLNYFAAGDESAAVFLAEKAKELLFAKLENPFAACAGAYVLLDGWLRQPRGTQWLDWIDNLAAWFPWLPDGQVLRGWVALAMSDGQPKQARQAFVEAARRGIPVYTAGLKRLVDGLTRVANDDRGKGREDPDVVEALTRMRRIAWNADPRVPFTTVRVWFENLKGERDVQR